MTDPAIISSLLSLSSPIASWISRFGSEEKAAGVIKRVLVNELRLNLRVIESALGKKDLNKGSNVTVILAVIQRLEVNVSSQVFEGLGAELVALKPLDAKFRKMLETEKQYLPIASSISAANKLNFTTLLGFEIQKIAEMKALVSIQQEVGMEVMNPLKWADRLQNLREVMLFLVKEITENNK